MQTISTPAGGEGQVPALRFANEDGHSVEARGLALVKCWRAIRARKALLQDVLRGEIAARRGSGEATVLLDVAAGPGRYLLELAAELGGAGDLTIVCRELDPTGLAQGRSQARLAGLTCVRHERGDACDPASLAQVQPRPHIVVASGLYELLDAALIQRSMAGIHALLPPGGRFAFTTQVTVGTKLSAVSERPAIENTGPARPSADN
jgi:hypothetical protein